ncbi:hypothetical protein CH267_13095 [Rhodococcus sp. 06-621-2]|nr:hypothetical protein CH267_13095 [Rhodococcus sp. 06-621-2]
MEMRQLRALVAVSDSGSVTGAAKVLHIVQPAVTRQIATLESELGVVLFERNRSGMRLTPSGEQVLERARRALHEVDAAVEEARDSSVGLRGLVTVGLLPSSVHLVGPRVASAVAERHPGVRVRLNSGYAGYLSKWLEGGDVDIALLFDQPLSDGFSKTDVATEEILAIAAVGDVRSGAVLSLAEVLEHPLVLPSAPHGLRSLIEGAAAKTKRSLNVPVETNEVGLQHALVVEGHGWSLLPASFVHSRRGSDDVTAVRTDPMLSRTLTIARRISRRAPAVDAVALLLAEVVDDIVGAGIWQPVVRGN